MTDIVERLRKGEAHGVLIPCDDLKEAADEIERLRFRLEYMENKYGKIAWDAVVPPAELAMTKDKP
jgi:hypothetical protein